MKVLFDANVYNAMSFTMSDFEDAIIAATALRETAEYIITRDIKDFAQSPVPAITPGDFLRQNQ